MTENMQSKHKRMNERLNELSMLNGNIARLAFYVNESSEGLDGEARVAMLRQLSAMKMYRDELERRIELGWY